MTIDDAKSMIGSSGHTPKAGLPLYSEGDRPSYLGDWNGAMLIIDYFINQLTENDSLNVATVRFILDKLVELDQRVTALEGGGFSVEDYVPIYASIGSEIGGEINDN